MPNPEQQERNIVVFEDDKLWIKILQERLSEHGYTVVKWIASMPTEETIRELSELNVRAALVDGNLSPGEFDCTEGATIVRWIHDLNAGIITIGFAGGRNVKGADIEVGKLWASELVPALDTIFSQPVTPPPAK